MQDIALFDPPGVRQFAPAVPRDLAVVVAKCLERNPACRYLTPGEAADDLERFQAGQAILARPVGSVRRVGRWVKRNPSPTALVIVLFAALAGVSVLAAALNRTAGRERAALAREHAALVEEARLRREAEDAKTAADAAARAAGKARDDTRTALGKVEKALGETRTERNRADAERNRAEENLTLARQSVKHVLARAASLTEGDDPAIMPVYRDLLAGLEPFVARLLDQTGGDRELRFDQFEIARSLGLLEATMGQSAAGREHLLFAVKRMRELLEDDPGNARYRLELGKTLAFAGVVCANIGGPRAGPLLREARETLEGYLKDHPNDPEALFGLVRVRLSYAGATGEPADEHNLAVIDLVDQLTRLVGPTANLATTRAHALNNIASDLTNRGKTDEAEAYWLEVLAIREALYKSLPQDRVVRYELGKCLANYANQLVATGRRERAFQLRERAAGLFDALRDDARYRTSYIAVMVSVDFLLAAEYTRRREPDRATDRWNKAIALNAVLLERDPRVPKVRADQANAYTRRAELAEQAGRHADAARDYRAAIEYSTHQPHAEYCTAKLAQALARSGDRTAATAAATGLDPEKASHVHPCLELARAWLAIAGSAGTDSRLTPGERERLTATAHRNARDCIAAARKKGFGTPDDVKWFHAQKEFEPIWDVFPRDSG
jgi:tetratricopeptide (TPR) repeat protein